MADIGHRLKVSVFPGSEKQPADDNSEAEIVTAVTENEVTEGPIKCLYQYTPGLEDFLSSKRE